MLTKCPYCEIRLEACMGALGICPDCRTIWPMDLYQKIMLNPCPKCGATKAKLSEHILEYGCSKCHHIWYPGDDSTYENSETEIIYSGIDIDALLKKIDHEMKAADNKHGSMVDPEEGWYTAECEFTEWKKEVFKRNKEPEKAEKECIQLICMGIKWLRDCLPQMIKEKEKKDGNN